MAGEYKLLQEALSSDEELLEYETYTDEHGNTYDDEGNVVYTGASQGVRGLRDSSKILGGGYSRPRRRTTPMSDLDKAISYAKKQGVPEADVRRYHDEADGKMAVVYARIKKKAGVKDDPLAKVIGFAKKNGVSEDDVRRYWNDAKGNERAVYARIKNKAKRK
jgi:hypothetical protein